MLLVFRLFRKSLFIFLKHLHYLIKMSESPRRSLENFNPYTEFKEFTRQQIKNFRETFDLYDTTRDGFIDSMELEVMMVKLDAPQTYLALKAMMKEVDEDMDTRISFREFLLIFRKAASGELQVDGLKVLADKVGSL
ncbi:EF-hand domain-containing protein D2-like [Ciona intestinalis]